MSRIKRRPFSLLEICVCIAILAMASGFLGIKIKETIDYHRFESSISAFVADLKRMQSLASSYQSEFGVEIKPDKDHVLSYAFFTDEPSYAVRRLPKGKLKGIKSLSLEERKVEKITLTILPSGRVGPTKRIGLHDDEKARWIDLRYPLQIKVLKEYAQK